MDNSVGKTWSNNIKNHPPVITIFIGGMFTNPESWVANMALFSPNGYHVNLFLPTLSHYNAHYQPSLSFIMVD